MADQVTCYHTNDHYQAFLEESNRIEGIRRPVSSNELNAFTRFMSLSIVRVSDLAELVRVFQPGAVLRDRWGLNVRVGNHVPPPGGPEIYSELAALLPSISQSAIRDHSRTSRMAFKVHLQYETLHPFTDCNGRSGRALWAWMYRDLSLGFLHRWYYQSLDYGR